MRALRLGLGLALLGALAAAPLRAQLEDEAAPPGPEAPVAPELGAPPPPETPESEQEAYWRARAAQARERLAAAQARLASAEADYQNLRQRHHDAGDPRAKVTAERDAARAEVAAAQHALDVELPEDARQAGALPGWIRAD
jgi:hypothetical protein